MPTGRGKCFDATKGYGFIEPDDGSGVVFVHITGVQGSNDGQQVLYDLSMEKGKGTATNLQVSIN